MIGYEPPFFRHTLIVPARLPFLLVHSLIVRPQPYCIRIACTRTTFHLLDFAPSIWPYIYAFLDKTLVVCAH